MPYCPVVPGSRAGTSQILKFRKVRDKMTNKCKNSKVIETKPNRKRKTQKISAHADGGPRSRVYACETLRSAPHRHEKNFSSAHVCRVTFLKFPHFPVKIGLFWGVGGVPKFFFYLNPNIYVT
jgi:hypothetical protein